MGASAPMGLQHVTTIQIWLKNYFHEHANLMHGKFYFTHVGHCV